MKKLLFFLLILVCTTPFWAQPSNQINLQAVARTTGSSVLANKTMTLKISLLEASATGTPVWVEQNSVTTNAYGLFNYSIGSGSPVGAYTYANVNWATKKFVKLEIDPAGGLNFATLSTEELKSVASANVAKTALSLNLPIDQTAPVSTGAISGLVIRSLTADGVVGLTSKTDRRGVFGQFIGDNNNITGQGVLGEANKNGAGVYGTNSEKGTFGQLGTDTYAGAFGKVGEPNFGAFSVGGGNVGIEIHSIATGLPYIDFAKDPNRDFDMRLALEETNSLVLQGGQLRVANSKTIGSLSYAYLTNAATPTGRTSDVNIPFSIRAEQRIAASEFDAFSDKRIKKDFLLSQNNKDLGILTKLEVTDYRHIDFVSKGDAYKKGFIAQQVEQIFPEAVSKSEDYIPNIYQPATKATVQNEVLRIDMASNHGFVKGDKVRFYVKNKMHELEVSNTEGASFTIDNWKNGDAEEVFVYGKQVNDFRTVDYDRIFTLNVSATQELIKRNEDLTKRVAELEKQNQNLENGLKTLEGKVGSILKHLNTDGTSRNNREGVSTTAQINQNSSTPKTVNNEK